MMYSGPGINRGEAAKVSYSEGNMSAIFTHLSDIHFGQEAAIQMKKADTFDQDSLAA